MKTRPHDWVTLHEASEAVKVSPTTIRDWYLSGAIESKSPVGGTRMVRLLQVQEHAMGFRPNPHPSARELPRKDAIQDSESPEAAARLAASILDLQSIARERLGLRGGRGAADAPASGGPARSSS